MGFFSNLFGLGDSAPRNAPRDVLAGMGQSALPENDEQAIARYRYMLRTAPPETIEQAHAEAFAKLTTEQRRQVITQLTNDAPPAEQAAIAATSASDPAALARVATRAELRNPGMVERTLAGGGGLGLGASLFASFAMGFAGSMVAQSVFGALGGFGAPEAGASDEGAEETAQADDEPADDGSDFGGEDFDV